MTLKFKYLEAIHYGKQKIFDDISSPIWSLTSIHQTMMTDAYVNDVFDVLISTYCNINRSGRFVFCEEIFERSINFSWFKNFIILCKPTIHDNGDVTLIKTYTKDSEYAKFVRLVHVCSVIEVIDLTLPLNPKFFKPSVTSYSAIGHTNSQVLTRYQNLQKLNGG